MSDTIIAALLTGGVVTGVAVFSALVALLVRVGRILERIDVFGKRITQLESFHVPSGGSEED
jgi:hypothetical protein